MKKALGLAILAVMCLTGCGIFGEKRAELTDVSEIQKEYAKSKDDAKKKYDGKELTILSKVYYRSPVKPSITLGDPELRIECQFEESDPLFKKVSEDQLIKVKGVLKFTDSGAEIKPCKFVPF
jgi:hypothetical protein